VAIKGPIPGFVARLFEGSNVLGRGGDPDLIPTRSETRAISRRHATVEAEAGAFVIEPVGPVFVNERRIGDRTLLSHGDQVRLGRTLTFVLLVVP
jgi:pSer/pThr/pTyr-binding forkhead associated (FHA) protein